ncbi:MAG: SIR2 family protein [Anaerolineae bacterium]
MMGHSDIAFLLGAGAAVDAGLPTAERLAQLAEEGLVENHDSMVPVFRFISGAIHFGQACQGATLTAATNIEQILACCTLLARRNTHLIYPFVSAWHERVAQLQRLTADGEYADQPDSFAWLAHYCKAGLSRWLEIREPHRLKYLRNFVIDFTRLSQRLNLFTLNYDDCIERALAETIGPVNEKWTTGFDHSGWNPRLLQADGMRACLYKLHGSLDWVRDERLGVCSVRWPRADDAEELPADTDPLLIFGADVKLQAVDPYLTLLYHFQQALYSSRVLVTIGYSFGDDHINSMILRALQQDSQMRCVVVGPSGLGVLSRDTGFSRAVAVEKRFSAVQAKAKDAIENDTLVREVKRVLSASEAEPPFK